MKKRKILVLFPLLGLLLTGCDFKEVMSNVKNWISENIYHPVKDFIDGKTGEDEKEKEDEGGKEEEKTVKRIVVESYPESVAEGGTIAASAVTVRVFYSDNTEELKTAESVSIDTSVPGDNVPMTVEYGGKSDTVTVKVIAASEVVHVEDIRYEVPSRSLHVGDTTHITITFTPDNATDQTCTFTSDNEAVLTVTQTGDVTAVSAGSATVTVVSNDNANAKKEISFTVTEAAAGLPASTKAGFNRLATNETLLNGEKINIVGAIGSTIYEMPQFTSGTNIGAKAIELEDGKAVADEEANFTVIKQDDNYIALQQADGKYLTAGGSSNGLTAKDAISDASLFKYSVDENGNATLQADKVNKGTLCLNPNAANNRPIFSCYGSKSYEEYAIYHDGNGIVGPVAVTDVEFAQKSYELEVGNSITVVANVIPATAEDKVISYSLKDVAPEGALTIENNVITAHEVGTATVVAKSHDGGHEDEATVSAIAARNYGTAENPLSVSQAYALIEEVCPKDGDVTSKVIYCEGLVSAKGSQQSYGYQNVKVKEGETELLIYSITMNNDQKAAHDVGKILKFHGYAKNYQGTLEFASKGSEYVYADEIRENFAPVEEVQLSEQLIEIELGTGDKALTASVLPANADQRVTWAVGNENIATFENGAVHGVAVGETTVTATSVADPTKSATCSVKIKEKTKELVSVQIKTMPKVEYMEGDKLDLSDLVLTLIYDDQSTEDVTTGYTTNIALDHELTTEDTELIITYGKFVLDPIALTVTAKPQPTHAGTADDPYSIKDCEIVYANAKLEQGKDLGKEVYVAGTILGEPAATINNGRGRLYIGDASSENSLYIYNINNIGGSANLTLDDIPAGSEVLAKGTLKNYNGMQLCYVSNVANCEFISITKPVVAVESVSLDKNELNLVVGMPDETLVATVLPENATNKAVEWESANPEVATVNDGAVHAVAAGDTTVTVKSLADSSKTASCTVHVTKPEKQLVSIEVTTMPKTTYQEGDLLDLSGMVVTLHYNDQSTAEITSGWTTNIALDHELTTEDTSLVVSYGGFSADPIALTVTAKPQPTHAGTQADPYTIKDCEIVYANAKLEQGKDIGKEVFVKGTVLADPAATISSGRGRLYIGDDSSENSLYIYNINNIGGSNNLTLADIPAGSEVLAKGTLKNYNGMQLCYVSNVANCEFISIDKPVVAPTTVQITSGSELGVGSSMTLTATVGPEGASQDVEWSIVEGGTFATLADGVLTGVAAGDVKVRATAKGYENVYAEKTITVSSSVVQKSYTKVTDVANLADGDTIIITDESSAHALGETENKNNIAAVSVTVDGNNLKTYEGAAAIVLEAGANGGFYLKKGDKYIAAVSSSSNYLRTTTTKDDNALWTITYTNGKMSLVANGSYTRNIMHYNAQNNFFAAYASNSTVTDLMQIYKLA